ncbi:MAG: 16S rRNA (adenine(1518)-N(6)/adenine(1519)-N(6))-dimethyltransferase RsmA [Clostridia bacterium]|nr:16S rRNA (adenine(1518)-N(6)/adenine(1519)-N(6))-dimethyltransferase RsmA [Clostridia bacterium]
MNEIPIQELLARHGLSTVKALGQNFLRDPQVLEAIAQGAGSGGNVLEIGAGVGSLTTLLASRAKKAVTVEIDRRLEPLLSKEVTAENHRFIWSDILKCDLAALGKEQFAGEKYTVVGNLPYYITTEILLLLFANIACWDRAVLMVQREVAERIAAKPGKKDYGAISVLCQYYTNPRLVTIVPAGSFYPAPKVDSAVLCMEVCDKPNVETKDEALFFKVVKAAFAQRRKTLLNCLASGFSCDKQALTEILESVDIAPNVRGEKLGLAEFAKIADAFWENGIR